VSLANRVDFYILDPMTGRVEYGARNALLERLLRDWLRAKGGAEEKEER